MYRLTARIDALEDLVAGCDSVLVAVSGELGSALVAHVASRTLGPAALIVPVRTETIGSEDVERLWSIANERGIRTVFDGENKDDERDRRSASSKARARGVRSPLVETGFTRADVRAAAKFLGLPMAVSGPGLPKS